MYVIKKHKKFEKSLERLTKAGLKQKQIDELYLVIKTLSQGEKLGLEYQDHKLHGEFSEYRECHIRGDLLLVYQIIKNELVLVLINIGMHNDLF